MMHGHEKSDPAIVAMKPANKAARSATEPSVKEPAAAESVERRAGIKGNADWQSTRRTQSRVSVSQALERIRQVGANALPFIPEVGAVCGKAASTVLCGGREVTRVPTASRQLLHLLAAGYGPLRDGRHSHAQPSLSGHCGHGWTCGCPTQSRLTRGNHRSARSKRACTGPGSAQLFLISRPPALILIAASFSSRSSRYISALHAPLCAVHPWQARCRQERDKLSDYFPSSASVVLPWCFRGDERLSSKSC
jgi:hypothetical protein